MSYTDILRELLCVRELLASIKDKASGLALEEIEADIETMQTLEHKVFDSVNEDSKP